MDPNHSDDEEPQQEFPEDLDLTHVQDLMTRHNVARLHLMLENLAQGPSDALESTTAVALLDPPPACLVENETPSDAGCGGVFYTVLDA